MTGVLDRRGLEDIDGETTVPAIYTECAHIIPQATFFGLDPKSEENSKVRGQSARILASNSRLNA